MGLQYPEEQSLVEKYVNQKLYFSGVDDTLGRIEFFLEPCQYPAIPG